ncbi:MAG: YeeE/YedE family protein [Candidatus Lokiarchaeota archaeon]|nr:YeeE/YedE family protein [Candidatus Lokiarchaeota archaeon]
MAIDIQYALIPGLILGIIFGFVLQRGRFCMNSAFRDVILLKEYKLAKSVALAILLSMLGFAIMSFADIITLNPKHFAWGANIIGGLIFGVGMVLAAGCASGTTYRVGEGMMGSLVALLGFAGGAYFTKVGALNPIAKALQDSTKITYSDNTALTLFGDLTPIFMLIIGIVGIALIAYFWIWRELRAKKRENKPMLDFSNFGQKTFKQGWHWAVTAVAIGIIASFAYVTSAASGRNYPLGITGGWVGWNKFWNTGVNSVLGWETWLVIGIVIGAFISAIIAKEFKLRTPKHAKTILIQFVGGLAMGIGAIIAMGCNIGNILSGFPLLSLGSLLSGVFIILGCWLMAYLLFMWRKN